MAMVPRDESPESRRRHVADDRPGTTRLDRREEATLQRQLAVADRVDAAVDRVQAAIEHAVRHGVARQAASLQLGEGEDAPLVRGSAGDPEIGTSGEFVGYMPTNSPLVAGGRGHPPTVAAGA
jgi:hypothetical protein